MADQETFQERLLRIAAEKESGPVTENKSAKREKYSAAGIPSMRENILYPLSFVRAVFVGVIAVFVSRFIRYHLAGGSLAGSQESADLVMMIDGIIAVGAGFALKELFKISDKSLQLAQTVGVFMMIVLMHNLVHMVPGLFGMIFSPEWVQDVLTTTEPKSILFRGVTFLLGDPVATSAVPSMGTPITGSPIALQEN